MDCVEKSDALFQEFWEWRLQNSPEFATFCGIHDFDDKLESYSVEAIEERKVVCRKYLNEAFVLLSDPNLSVDMKENLEFFSTDLNMYLKGSSAKGYLFPLNYMDGPHVEFPRLMDAMKFECLEDYQKLLSRFKELPTQISQMIELMRDGAKQNMTYHLVSVAAIPEQLDRLDQLDALQTRPQECIFYKPFVSLPVSIPDDRKNDLLLEAVESITCNVFPAFKMLKDFITTEYLQYTRPKEGVCCLRDGIEFYQMCLNFHLSFYVTPTEVHSMGLKEVERIAIEIEKVIAAFELKMSVKEFSERIRNDDSLYFNDAEEMLESYKDLIANKIQPKLKTIIKKIPKSPMLIEPTPDSMSDLPSEYYLAGTPDGMRPGIFYLNCKDCKSSPKYNMVTASLHEAIPGHHLQSSYLLESTNIPEFRKFVEDRRYSESPSHFSLHTAYIEGWALYCEYLGYELDMYEDLYFWYGYLAKEMFRALRLVVDTGIHVYGWSLDKAVQLMLEYTSFPKSFIEREVRRYITWPGQACAYKIGELKIKYLRSTAEKVLGPKFDILEFHDIVLQSCGPLEHLEQKIMQYIKLNS